ncbi:hypothetical protein L6452_43821 [Arctium lappa]|uniref:Uncharacterized protein n=1 Tax=Arctium lappa TaxID=4217 RepID=A0ACB8XEN7_ARCLA|nr:hypothetical protein L6452_43821 [Arctium lappa]
MSATSQSISASQGGYTVDYANPTSQGGFPRIYLNQNSQAGYSRFGTGNDFMSQGRVFQFFYQVDITIMAALISREMRSEKMEKPTIRYGYAAQSRKGEDYFMTKTDCQRVFGHQSSSFSVFAIFDGHNGNVAAVYSRDHLLNHVLSAIPRGLGRDEWLQVLPRALVAVTVASVGDSRCILDTQGGVVSVLTVDHRLEENQEERERVMSSGGEVGRLSIFGGAEVQAVDSLLKLVSELKQTAIFLGFASLNDHVEQRSEELNLQAEKTDRILGRIGEDSAASLKKMESHYYSSLVRAAVETL